MCRCTEIMNVFLEIPVIKHFFAAHGKARPRPPDFMDRIMNLYAARVTARLYDRIMNLYKHFCKALDSTGKLAIMVLALRNKEC